jgi:deoxyribonuclease V
MVPVVIYGGAAAAEWPATRRRLVEIQLELGALRPLSWHPSSGPIAVGACFVCFPRHNTGAGASGDPAWAAAVVLQEDQAVARSVVTGTAGAPYEEGLLALREGALLHAALRELARTPDVIVVNATGRDHPRRAGLALHLGAVLDVPTVGLTDRPLAAVGPRPADEPDQLSPLTIDDEVVAYWLRTRAGVRPVVVHAGWRVDAVTAIEVVRRCIGRYRTPAPLREARRIARRARSNSDT